MATAARTEGLAAVDDSPLCEPGTPYVLIDGAQLRANVATMQDSVAGLGAALRPHFKTHRTYTVAQMQLDAGAIGLTVATVRQLAAVREELGCSVVVSSLLQVDAAVSSSLRAASGDGLMFTIESPRSLQLLRDALGPELRADVLIEVEAGCRRSGADPSECPGLARTAANLGFDVVGLLSYPGHSYIPGQARQASEQERDALQRAAMSLERAGFEPRHISAGSTPSMPYARPGVVTEYRPGTYVFGDRQQLTLGAVQRSQLALTVVGTVVAVHGDRVVLDAGGKALGRDAPRWLPGFGHLAEDPEAVITRLYDHHSVIESYTGDRLSVGDQVAIVPNNANSVMVLPRSVWVREDGALRELRPVPDR